jgi:hypothetical protein
MEQTREAENESYKKWRELMGEVVRVAADKVELKPKEETEYEMFKRCKEERQAKENKSVKRAAKGLIRKKEMKTMKTYFSKRKK